MKFIILLLVDIALLVLALWLDSILVFIIWCAFMPFLVLSLLSLLF
jgi:hypothetical protein